MTMNPSTGTVTNRQNDRRDCATYRREKRLKKTLKDAWKQREMNLKLMTKEENLQKVFENEDKSTIQYHFLDGSICQRRYFCDATLRFCINDLIRTHPTRLPRAFKLSTVRPNCVFDSDDEDLTLNELGLVPLADVHVVPKITPVLTGGQRGIFGKLLAFILYLISFPIKLAVSTERRVLEARTLQSRYDPIAHYHRINKSEECPNNNAIKKNNNVLHNRNSKYYPTSLGAEGMEDSYLDSSSSATDASI